MSPIMPTSHSLEHIPAHLSFSALVQSDVKRTPPSSPKSARKESNSSRLSKTHLLFAPGQLIGQSQIVNGTDQHSISASQSPAVPREFRDESVSPSKQIESISPQPRHRNVQSIPTARPHHVHREDLVDLSSHRGIDLSSISTMASNERLQTSNTTLQSEKERLRNELRREKAATASVRQKLRSQQEQLDAIRVHIDNNGIATISSLIVDRGRARTCAIITFIESKFTAKGI